MAVIKGFSYSNPGGGGTVGMNMQWSDLPDATTVFRESDFSSASTVDTPFETTGDIGDNIWSATGGLSNGPYWTTRLKDPRPGIADAEATNSFKCWNDTWAADDTLLFVATATIEFSSALLTAMNPSNGGGKVFYMNTWNTNGTTVDTENELVIILNNGDQDQDNDTTGSYFNITIGGAGSNYQNDGVHTNLNIADRPAEKLWVAFVWDSRPASGTGRGTHIFYKYEGDPGITKAMYRAYDLVYNFTESWAQVDNGRGFANGGASGFKGNFFAYWDNITWAVDAAKNFKMYHHKSANGKFALPF